MAHAGPAALLLFAATNSFGQRVTAEDLGQNSSPGSDPGLLGNLLLLAVLSALVIGFFVSKGLRKALLIYGGFLGGIVLIGKIFGTQALLYVLPIVIIGLLVLDSHLTSRRKVDQGDAAAGSNRQHLGGSDTIPSAQPAFNLSREKKEWVWVYNHLKRQGIKRRSNGDFFSNSQILQCSDGYWAITPPKGECVIVHSNDIDGPSKE
jgi:hypothetical protein